MGKGHTKRKMNISQNHYAGNDKQIFNRIEEGDTLRLTGVVVGCTDKEHVECIFNNDRVVVTRMVDSQHVTIRSRRYGHVNVRKDRVRELVALMKEQKLDSLRG